MGKVTPERIFICVQGLKKIIKATEGQLTELGPIRKPEGVALKIENVFNTVVSLGPSETNKLVCIDRTKTQITLPNFPKGFSLKHDQIMKMDCKRVIIKNNPNGRNPVYSGLFYLPDNCLLLADSFNEYYCIKSSVARY